jgi:transposase-like protein
MALLSTSSYRTVELTISCQYCKGQLYKHGKSGEGKQRFRCRSCGKTQLAQYSYNAYDPKLNQNIIALTKEGVGIRETARLLGITLLP